MKLIKDYEKALRAIYNHVGFVENWVEWPLKDLTDKYWGVSEESKKVYYANTKQELEDQRGSYWIDGLYEHHLYKKWIYEGKAFTMIFCYREYDIMSWFKLFDNNKRVVTKHQGYIKIR